jgi:hypothetical protein
VSAIDSRDEIDRAGLRESSPASSPPPADVEADGS